MTLAIKQHKENGYYVIFEWDKSNVYRVAVCPCYDENRCGYPINEMTYSINDKKNKEQAEAIEKDIYKVMDEWEEENGDFAEFDYYMCIYEAVEKHIQIAENPIVKTIYI